LKLINFRRALVLYAVVTVVGVLAVAAAAYHNAGPEAVVPAFSGTQGEEQRGAYEQGPGPTEQNWLRDTVQLDVEFLKELLRTSISLLRSDSQFVNSGFPLLQLFERLLRYLTGITPGDPRTVFATQLPHVTISEDDPVPGGGELILPQPKTDIIVTRPSSAPEHIDPEVAAAVGSGQPLVLIYHTHTQEAYLGPDFRERGLSHDDAFSPHLDRNVVGVGAEMARTLRESYGIEVIHVTDYFDMRPDGGVTKLRAYVRSLQGVQPIVRANPQLRLIVDVHRDAFPESVPISRTVAAVGGEGQGARVMFVVGQGRPGLAQPYWEHNLQLAKKLNAWLEVYYPGLSRGIFKVDNRYNQHLGPGALLIEIGEVQNTVPQAKLSARIVADALARQLLADNVKRAEQVQDSR
jgi:stage II sporulation protein P